MTEYGCYIGGCVRNCSKYLPKVFENIKLVGGLFSSYTVIIAYDESSDESLQTLKEMKSQIPNLIIIQNKTPLTNMRAANIGNARNLILKRIRKLQNAVADGLEYKYMIMIDMDDVCETPIDISVLSRYLIPTELVKWDSLSFNRPEYYDIWALSIDSLVLSCWHWGNNPNFHFSDQDVPIIMRKYVTNKLNSLKSDDLLECYSAFNGFAIYKLSHFLECVYDANFVTNMKLIPQQMVHDNMTFLNRPFYTYFMEDCEHRHFHIQAMITHGALNRISPLILFPVMEK